MGRNCSRCLQVGQIKQLEIMFGTRHFFGKSEGLSWSFNYFQLQQFGVLFYSMFGIAQHASRIEFKSRVLP